jgi:hypothetical protein
MTYDLGYSSETKTPRQARRAPIGYGDDYYGEDEPVIANGMPLGMRNELLDKLGGQTTQFTRTLFDWINTPTSYALDALSGKPIGSGTTGEKFLDEAGLLPEKETLYGLARPVASFGVEAAVDPLNLVTFGTGAVSKAARAAKAANIFTDAQRAASRALIDNGGTLGKYGQNAADTFKTQFGKGLDDLTDADLAARPLVGPREARKSLNLEQLVNAQDDSQKAIDDINDYLSRYGQSYADVKSQKLGGDIGFRLPFTDTSAVFNIPGLGDSFAKGLDRAGQLTRWSLPGRYAYSMFDRNVAGATDEGGQIIAKQITSADQAAEALARRKAADLMQSLPESAYTPRVGNALRNVIEGTADAAEQALVSGDRRLSDFVDNWRLEAKTYLDRSQQAGIGSAALQDKFGTKYFPRFLDDDTFGKAAKNVGAGKNFSVMTGDQLARAKAFNVPGGTKTLQELSLDRQVAGPGRLKPTDREAAEYIKAKLDMRAAMMGSTEKYSLQSAYKLARTLQNIEPEAIAKKYPIFGQHPVENIAKYFAGRERAISRANALYDILGSSATRNNYLDSADQIPLRQAFRDLKLKSTPVAYQNLVSATPTPTAFEGAKQQILDRLQTRAGFSGVDLDELKNISINQSLMDRLNRVADFYQYPESQSKVLKLFDNITQIWKGSILSWPARFARDWMSGMFSNVLEVGSPQDVMRGYAGARFLTQGQWGDLDGILSAAPRYAGMNAASRKRTFLNDLAAGGVLSGRRLTDLGEESAAKAAGTGIRDEYLPGVSPQTTLGYQITDALSGRTPLPASRAAYSELGKNWRGFFGMGTINPNKKIRDEITNPILRWSNKLGDNTDTINRAAGYIGLILQGVSPEAAARRIKDAHVDYSSLTKVEREWFRRVMPFWSYTSRIGNYVTRNLLDDPGGRMFQFGIRLPERIAENSGGEEYVPSSIRSRYGLSLEPMRDIPVISDAINAIAPKKEGTSAWLADIDLPGIDQLNQIKVQTTLEGKPKVLPSTWSTFQSFAGQGLNPMLKTGLETLTGQDFYTMRSKQSSPATLQVLGRRAGFVPHSLTDRALGLVDPAVQLAPFAPRVLQTTRRLTDPNIESMPAAASQAAFNALTGVKVQNITDDIKRWDALEKIKESLAGDPNLRVFEQTYIPEEARPFTDPEVLELYDLQRQLNREQRGRNPKGKRKKRGPNDFYNPLNY